MSFACSLLPQTGVLHQAITRRRPDLSNLILICLQLGETAPTDNTCCGCNSRYIMMMQCSDTCLSYETLSAQVCDYRCGSGEHGDFNCDWRGLGSTCRLCFHELPAAHLADEFAKAHGGRVIMCNTHEPPPPIRSYTHDKEEEKRHGGADAGGGSTSVIPPPQKSNTNVVSVEGDSDDPAATEYIGTTARGHMCAFLRGHSRLLPIMKVSVSSILEFMPGMRIGIATHPTELGEFNRSGCRRRVRRFATILENCLEYMNMRSVDS